MLLTINHRVSRSWAEPAIHATPRSIGLVLCLFPGVNLDFWEDWNYTAGQNCPRSLPPPSLCVCERTSRTEITSSEGQVWQTGEQGVPSFRSYTDEQFGYFLRFSPLLHLCEPLIHDHAPLLPPAWLSVGWRSEIQPWVKEVFGPHRLCTLKCQVSLHFWSWRKCQGCGLAS